MEAVLRDVESAPIDARMKAMLRFLEKMTLEPEALTRADADRLRQAGLRDDAIRDAIGVAFAFNLIDRLADSFDFDVPTAEQFAAGAPTIMRRGYRM